MVGLLANKLSLWVIPLFVLCAVLPLSDTQRRHELQRNKATYRTIGEYTVRRLPLLFLLDKWYTVNLYEITQTRKPPERSGRKCCHGSYRKNMLPSRVRVEVGVGVMKSEILEYPKGYFEGKLRYLLKMQNKSDARNIKPVTFLCFIRDHYAIDVSSEKKTS